MDEREKDMRRRFGLINEALDGLSNHDKFGLIGGKVGFILAGYIEEFANFKHAERAARGKENDERRQRD